MVAVSCACCGKELPPTAPMCSQCKSVAYCGVECQRKDWKAGHKKACKLLAAAPKANAAESSQSANPANPAAAASAEPKAPTASTSANGNTNDEAQAKAKAKAETEAKAKAETEAKAKAKAEAEAKAKAQAKAEAEAEAEKSQAQAKAKAQAEKQRAEEEAKAKAKAEEEARARERWEQEEALARARAARSNAALTEARSMVSKATLRIKAGARDAEASVTVDPALYGLVRNAVVGVEIEQGSGGTGSFLPVGPLPPAGSDGTSVMKLSGLSPGRFYTARLAAEIDVVGKAGGQEVTHIHGEPHAFQTVSLPPGAPKSLSVVSRKKTELKVGWSAPEDDGGALVESYILEIAEGPFETADGQVAYDPHLFSPCFEGDELSHRIVSLQAGRDYAFVVSAVTAAGRGPPKGPVVFSTQSSVPGPVETVTVTGFTCSTIDVAWLCPEPHGSAIESFTVEYRSIDPSGASKGAGSGGAGSGGSGAGGSFESLRVGAEARSLSIGSLRPLTLYEVRVKACNAIGEGPSGSSATVATAAALPGRPGRPRLTRKDETLIAFEWGRGENAQEDGSDGATAVGYRVLVAQVGDGEPSAAETDAEVAASVGDAPLVFREVYRGTGTSHEVIDMMPGRVYCVRVTCFNAVGESAPSEDLVTRTVPRAPAAPVGLKAMGVPCETPSNPPRSALQISWAPPAEVYGCRVLTYDVECNGETSYAASVPAKLTTHLVQGLPTASEFVVRVRATTRAGAGEWSNPVLVDTLPGAPAAPAGLTVAKMSPSSATIRFDPAAEHGSAVTRYTVSIGMRDRDGDPWPTDLTPCATVDAPKSSNGPITVSLPELGPATGYAVSVTAHSNSGRSPASDLLTFVTPLAPPAAPINVSAEPAGRNDITVSWGIDAGSPPLKTFHVTVDDGTAEDFTAAASVPAPDSFGPGTRVTATVGGLQPGKRYRFRVQGVGPSGSSPQSKVVTAMTNPDVPSAPAGLSLGGSSHVSLRLKWRPARSPGTVIDKYIVQQSNSGESGPWFHCASTDRCDLRVGSLEPSTGYSFRVRAVNKEGEGPFCAPFTGETTAAPRVPIADRTVEKSELIQRKENAPTGNSSDDQENSQPKRERKAKKAAAKAPAAAATTPAGLKPEVSAAINAALEKNRKKPNVCTWPMVICVLVGAMSFALYLGIS